MDNLQDHLNKNPELKKQLTDLALGAEQKDQITGEENPNFCYDDELPNVSILMPTWNRRHFLPLILINIHNMDYPKHKLELVIYDDHPVNPLFNNQDEVKVFQSNCNLKINYIYNPIRHLSIGEKRNKLVKAAKYKLCINMDDDDIYFPEYIRYSVNLLKSNKAGIVGSPEMLFTYPHNGYSVSALKCVSKRQAHEATFCFTKKHWKSMGGFNEKGVGEGARMIDYNEKHAVMSDITQCMCCVAHQNNTVSKDKFIDMNRDVVELVIPDIYKELIDSILNSVAQDI